MSSEPTFERDALVDKPGIIGARWWHAALADEQSKIARRQAIKGLLIAGGVIAGFGAIVAVAAKAASRSTSTTYGTPTPGTSEVRKTALEMQQDYGWSFGANDEALVFDGVTTTPFDPNALTDFVKSMTPAQAKLVRFWQPTLFQSPYASPNKSAEMDPDDVAALKKLADVMKPIFTPAMATAYAAGQTMATLARAAKGGTGLVVDLAGPEAVAFAAGAADFFDPVFLFDNWPHPRGVVHAHETLSAAIYYQPLFAKKRDEQSNLGDAKPPMFVLDRNRLATYTDEATQFDNRYVAKLPWPAGALTTLGIDHLYYVVPTAADQASEQDDINDDFVSYAAAKLDLRGVPLSAITADAKWPLGLAMSPVARKTTYSSGGPPAPAASRPRPTTFGTVPVLIAVGTGAIVGYRYARSGSWNRSTGGGYSG